MACDAGKLIVAERKSVGDFYLAGGPIVYRMGMQLSVLDLAAAQISEFAVLLQGNLGFRQRYFLVAFQTVAAVVMNVGRIRHSAHDFDQPIRRRCACCRFTILGKNRRPLLVLATDKGANQHQ